MFSKKIQYYNITIKSQKSNDIKLSLLEGNSIRESINEFNSHIQDKNEHLKNVFTFVKEQKVIVNLDYKIDRDIVLFRD